MPRARSAWHTSRPSASGSPMSMISASGCCDATRSSASAPVVASAGANPSSFSPRSRRPPSSTSSSRIRTRGSVKRSSLLSQNRAQRQVPHGPGSGEQREPGSYDRARGQLTQEPPRYRERIGWWVEYVLKHRYEHLREHEAEDRREHQTCEQDQYGLAPEERADGADRAPTAANVAGPVRAPDKATPPDSHIPPAASATAKA